jgi:hypothetical protein
MDYIYYAKEIIKLKESRSFLRLHPFSIGLHVDYTKIPNGMNRINSDHAHAGLLSLGSIRLDH